LGPPPPPPPRRVTRSGRGRPFPAEARLRRGGLLTATGVLNMPGTPFLDQATPTAPRLMRLSPEQRAYLAQMRQEAVLREARLRELATLSQQITVALNAASLRLGRETLVARQAKQQMGQRLQQARARLATVGPAVLPTRAVCAKQIQVIDRSLKAQ